MATIKKKRIIAGEGYRFVNRKLKEICYAVRLPIEEIPDWVLTPEVEAFEIDKEWHPWLYYTDAERAEIQRKHREESDREAEARLHDQH